EVPAEGTLEQHELVAAAIARGDADAAEDLSRGHMRQVWTEIHVD
ncbi:FCD domain-containing protein, partial [Bacillus sp. SIMBA_005]